MFSQRQELTAVADGRFATDVELQPLKDYLATAETRRQIYQAMREQSSTIIDQVIRERKQKAPSVFEFNGQDQTEICRRDLEMMLRVTASAILFADLDRQRSNALIWYRTITTAFSYQQKAAQTYKLFREVVKRYLPSETTALADPALQLNVSVLS